MIASKRITIYENLDYQLDLEYNKDYLILHLPRVSNFRKSILLDGLAKLDELYNLFKTMGHKYIWAACPPENKRVNRLLLKAGFRYMGNADGMSVYNYGDY